MISSGLISENSVFQSTFPRGERLLIVVSCTWMYNYFNPRSLVGNDGAGICKTVENMIISIHVPSWGTTHEWSFWANFVLISIHVPSWGTTERMRLLGVWEDISIHVPSWGTTKHECWIARYPAFQSTFPRGERLQLLFGNRFVTTFQSTFPRGERRQIFTNILCFFMQ